MGIVELRQAIENLEVIYERFRVEQNPVRRAEIQKLFLQHAVYLKKKSEELERQ